jgi:hypothetical protein
VAAATNTPAGICNLAAFEADVSYPDDTVVPSGKNFDKKWRLRNNGTCTWTSGYRVIFVSGDAMGGAGSVQLTNGTVEPGAAVTVSVNLPRPPPPVRTGKLQTAGLRWNEFRYRPRWKCILCPHCR